MNELEKVLSLLPVIAANNSPERREKIALRLMDLLRDEYNSGFDAGYEIGYEEGRDDGVCERFNPQAGY